MSFARVKVPPPFKDARICPIVGGEVWERNFCVFSQFSQKSTLELKETPLQPKQSHKKNRLSAIYLRNHFLPIAQKIISRICFEVPTGRLSGFVGTCLKWGSFLS